MISTWTEEGYSALLLWSTSRSFNLYVKKPKLHHQQEIGLLGTSSCIMETLAFLALVFCVCLRLWMVDQIKRGGNMILSPMGSSAAWELQRKLFHSFTHIIGFTHVLIKPVFCPNQVFSTWMDEDYIGRAACLMGLESMTWGKTVELKHVEVWNI